MDALKLQLAKIQEQLGALSASQKMLVGSLVAVMVMTLLFWSRYAGTADMEPVLDQALKSDEIARITAQIRSKGIDYKVTNERILVPTDRKLEVLADLSFKQLVPQDTRGAYDEIIKRVNPFGSQSDNDATRNDAKAAYLAQVIRKFPGVLSADVIIDPTTERRIGGGARNATAAVFIQTEDPGNKRGDRVLVDAAATTVHGAQSGLELKNINIVVNGIRYNVNDRDPKGLGGSDEMLTLRHDAEKDYVDKITQQLSFIGTVFVAVTCDLNIKSEDRNEKIYDPKGVIQKEIETTTDTREETAPALPMGEPGAQSNTALAVGPGASGGTSGGGSTTEKNTSKYQILAGETTIESHLPPGKTTVVGAVVRVPRSYFVGLFKANNPPPAGSVSALREPDDAALKPIIDAELAVIRGEVKRCVDLSDDEKVSVFPYNDSLPLMAAATMTVATNTNSTGFTSALTGHYKEIVLGVLALVSLFMVSSIVKKSSPAPAVATAVVINEPHSLSSGEDVAGDVSEGNNTLDGMELDDDAVKAQQMVEQVSTMVKENPEGAANLVKRWLNRN